jgi:hypothetical protein
MLSSIKEQKNIPVSISILHEQEYKNLCFIYKLLNKAEKRRAFSENNKEKIIKKDNFKNIGSKTPNDILIKLKN